MTKENLKKIAIIWANPYNSNLGVTALAYSAIAILNDVLMENGFKAEFTFIGGNRNDTDSIEIRGKKIVFNNLALQDYSSWKAWLKLGLLPLRYKLPKLLSFDCIFDLGEGDSFADIYGQNRFDRIYSTKVIFSMLGKKQVLLPQTIGPFSDPVNKQKADKVMQKMEMVLSRDKMSYDYTKDILPDYMIAEVIDLAFYLPYEKGSYQDKKVHVGINISGLLWNGGYTRNNQFNLKLDYKQTILELIEYFTQTENVTVHLIPHVIPESFPVEDDYSTALEIKEKFPSVIVSPRFKNAVEAKSYISGMDFFTGARMHSCIAAFSSGVPVIPMAYSRKFNGLFEATLKYPNIADCVNESQDEVVQKIKKGFNERLILERAVSESLDNIVNPRLSLLKKILSSITNNSN